MLKISTRIFSRIPDDFLHEFIMVSTNNSTEENIARVPLKYTEGISWHTLDQEML